MVIGTKNIQADAEAWNRNVDLLNLITVGQAMYYKGSSDRDVKLMYDGLMWILYTITPMMKNEEEIAYTKQDGTTEKRKVTYVGMNTKIFKIYMNNMIIVEKHMIASRNPNYDRETRFQAAGEAYRLLVAQAFHIFQEVEAMGFNIKMKNPGYAAGITGG